MKKRIDYIDIIKGIGIILVIMCHTGYLGVWSKYVDAFFMPLFFISAGMVYKKPLNRNEFIKRKVKVLLLPYFIWNFFCILITMLMGRKIGLDAILGIIYGRFAVWKIGLGDSNPYLLLHYNNSHLWFLPCMFIVSILYMLIDAKINGWKKTMCVIILFFLGGIIGKYSPVYIPWSVDNASVMCGFYYLGVHQRRAIENFKMCEKDGRINILIILLLLLIFIPISIMNGEVNVSLSDYGNNLFLFFVAAIMGSEIIIFLSFVFSKLYDSNLIKIYLKWIGRNSMDIYGLHMLLVTCMAHLVNKMIAMIGFIDSNVLLESGIVSLSFVLPVTGGGYLFYMIKRKIQGALR